VTLGQRLPLAASWDAELVQLPADWSDLLAEVVFTSSDYIEPAAVFCIALNPRRESGRNAFRFRVAQHAGYGASPGMVRRCFERCDAHGISGAVEVLRALSGSHSAGTQGPVWQISGRTV